MALPVPERTCTAAPVLPAIVLATPATVPPIVLSEAPPPMTIPAALG